MHALLLLCVLVAGYSPSRAAEEALLDGVPHVRNPATPRDGVETLVLEELWRAGGEDDEAFFGVIFQVRSDEEGNVYLMDSQLSQVFVYAPDGRLLRTLSREGEGPGEVRVPYDMVFLPDGSLGLAQRFPGKLIRVDREDRPLPSIVLRRSDLPEGFVAAVDANCRAGRLVISGVFLEQTPAGQARISYLARFSEEGLEEVRYWQKEMEIDFNRPHIVERDIYGVFPRRWALGPQGEVYAAVERDRYRIHVYAADGALQRVIEREFAPPPRTAKQKRRTEQLFSAQLRPLGPNVGKELSDTEPAIQSIRVDDGGMLWVLNAAGIVGQPPGVMATYDLFDPEGQFVKQVAVRCEGQGEDDGLFFLGGDRMVRVTQTADALLSFFGGGDSADDEAAEPAPVEVIYYRIADRNAVAQELEP